MIKCELGKKMISGHPAQIATELEILMRSVREVLCRSLGENIGMGLYEEVVRKASMSEEQREKNYEDEMMRMRAENPNLAKLSEDLSEALVEMLFGQRR